MTNTTDQGPATSYGPAMQKMLDAFPDAIEKSNGWWAHPDNPRFDFREGEHGEISIHSWTNRTDEDILASHGLKLSTITSSQRGYYRAKVRDHLGLVDLAQAKGIHYHELENLGLRDGYKCNGHNCVKIPYYYADGTQCPKIKVRKAIYGEGSEKQQWDKDTPGEPPPYGLWLLAMATEAGYLFIGEGESDGWACWHHHLPFLGIPGATWQKCLTGIDLNAIPRIYILHEPDQMQKLLENGQGFYKNVHRKLRDEGYTGKIFCIHFEQATERKDPSELHYRLWLAKREGDFVPIMQKAMETALPANDDEMLAMKTLDEAIAVADTEALFAAIPTIASMDRIEYLRYEVKIKQAFGKLINFNTFSSAIAAGRKDLDAQRARARKSDELHVEYEKTDAGMCYYGRFGEPVPLSNFSAEILSDVITDDGADQTRSYEVAAELAQRQYRFHLPAKDFSKCDWVDEHLGAKARITTGQSIKSHLVNAIKSCSDPQEHFKYAHTGWRSVDGHMIYLHAGGYLYSSQVSQVEKNYIIDLTNLSGSCEPASQAISDNSENENSQFRQLSQVSDTFSVSLTGPLAHYLFPDSQDDIKQAIRASLCFLELTQDIVTVPLYCALWRSVLPSVDFGIHLAGQTGWGKTELVALIQQHFGAEMDAHKLPGSWESTENSLEMLLFQAKDTVVVIDDFKPKGSKGEQSRLHAKADRIFRQVGNGATRGRLTSNLEQRAERRPRCMLISTGEDVPRGQSLKARGVVLTMSERITTGGAARNLLDAQREARNGLYVQAMAGYLEWLAPIISTIQAQLPDLIAGERNRLNIDGHGRAGTNTANLLLGMKLFLRFACNQGAITPEEVQTYLARCEKALRAVADEASSENTYDRPSEQWSRLIISALTSKKAHLVTVRGDNPGLEYGWMKSIRAVEVNGEIRDEETFRPGGLQIGWIDGDDIYLLPDAAYSAVKMMGAATGEEITTREVTLRKFLVQDRVLASTGLETSRKTIPVRRSLEGVQRDVLHIKRGRLYPDDPPVNRVDYPAYVDYEASQSAPQAESEASQLEGDSAQKSTDRVDLPPGDLTNSDGEPENEQGLDGERNLPTLPTPPLPNLPPSTLVNTIAGVELERAQQFYQQFCALPGYHLRIDEEGGIGIGVPKEMSAAEFDPILAQVNSMEDALHLVIEQMQKSA